MARPRKSEGRDTRREILDAALDLFAVGGYFGTSMRQIARAVGVRESALYHHFASKEAILGGLLAELGPARAEQLTEIDVEAVVRRVGVEGLLRGLVDRVIDEWATPREQKLLRLVLSEGPRLGTAGILHPREVIARASRRAISWRTTGSASFPVSLARCRIRSSSSSPRRHFHRSLPLSSASITPCAAPSVP